MKTPVIETVRKAAGEPALVYGGILVFCCLRLFHLNTPYFWDELGVYAKAALYMFDNGITLLPGHLPPELSRGHPLACAAFFAAAYRLFGPEVWAGHLAALAVSGLLLVVTYEGGKRLSGHRTGAIACLLLMVQPVFIAQSTMVLPEMLLALLATAAVFAYVSNRLVPFAVLASLALMTKETAVAIPVTIWSIEFFRFFLGRKAQAIRACIAAFIPVVCWGVFLLLQKHADGWYFFPLHSGYVSFALDQILPRWGYYVSFLFKGQGRILWTVILASALGLYLWKNRGRLVGTAAGDLRSALVEKQPVVILWVYIGWGVVVSMLNFHLGRYSLFVIPSLCLLVAQSLEYISADIRAGWFRKLAVAMAMVMALAKYSSKTFNVDADMGYLHVVSVHSQAIDFINRNYRAGTGIMSSFPFNASMMEPRSGYGSKEFRHVDGPCRPPHTVDAEVFVYSLPGNLENCTPDTTELDLQGEFTASFAKVLVYARKMDEPFALNP